MLTPPLYPIILIHCIKYEKDSNSWWDSLSSSLHITYKMVNQKQNEDELGFKLCKTFIVHGKAKDEKLQVKLNIYKNSYIKFKIWESVIVAIV